MDKPVTTDARETAAQRISSVEAHSALLRKELGVVDLVLTQILYVVGSAWVGTAAKLGPAHLGLWLAAIVLFYLPQAAVVIYLNRLMPVEGGLYQWTTVSLGRFAGFWVAWNQWAYTVVIMATFAVIIPTNLAYVLTASTDRATTLIESRAYITPVSVGVILTIAFVTLHGLRVGKWFQNIGGAAQFLMFAALIAVPFVALRRGEISSYEPLTAAVPAVTLFNLNLFTKMALGALSGFEYVAILAGECRSPARTIRRSVLVAVPIIALMFILGTSSVVALVPADKIDLVSPIPQTLKIGFQGMAFAGYIVPALICLLLLRQLGSMTLLFAGNTRLPLVTGWDGLLPAWFTRLDPRFRTPRNSILFVALLTAVLSLAGQTGVGVQEAFQVLENTAGIFYALTYLALFAIPILAARRLPERPPLWLRAAAVCGFGVTLLYAALAVIPIIDVDKPLVFAAKIIVCLVAANLVGVGIYAAAARRAGAAARSEHAG
jgi:amino acid transporter